MTNREKAIEALEKNLEELERKQKYFDLIKDILEPFDGKKISKRIETAIKKKYPELRTYYAWETNYSKPQIFIEKETFELAGYSSDGIFSFSWFLNRYKIIQMTINDYISLKNDEDGKLSKCLKYENYINAKIEMNNLDIVGHFTIKFALNVL